jgi:hypothetical protein
MAVVIGVVAGFLAWSPVRTALRNARFADARREFHLRREWLETKFIGRAATKSKGDAFRWAECEFDNDVAYVRNRSTGELAAFVAITVGLEEPDDQRRTDRYQAGTAVFRFFRHHWDTDGVALLNLTPSEAVRFYQENLEIVAHELAG